jgi:hypothetical protein
MGLEVGNRPYRAPHQSDVSEWSEAEPLDADMMVLPTMHKVCSDRIAAGKDSYLVPHRHQAVHHE